MNLVAKQLNPMGFPPVVRKLWQTLEFPYYTLKGLPRRPEGVPPLTLMFDGVRSYRGFVQNGREFLRHYTELARLRPNESILDVGSGIGRKTLPLVAFLNDEGSYIGMDIVKAGIDWCREHYKRYPNFEFFQIDVRNDHYNPTGRYAASEYKFPFTDARFDFVVLNSVFTHMLAHEVENYVSQVARVLKTGGRCLISFFLLNDESVELIEQHQTRLDLRYRFGPARAVSRDRPELAVGYDESFVKDLLNRHGLEIATPIHYGSWCGRNDYLAFQDLVVAWKVSAW
jgi:SAM-dependent methyltransferase